MRSRKSLYICTAVVFLIEIAISTLLKIYFDTVFAPFLFGFALVNSLITVAFIAILSGEKVDREAIISQSLYKNSDEAIQYGNVGIITVDDDFLITFCGGIFSRHTKELEGVKISTIIPETTIIFQGDADKVAAYYNERYYEITKKSGDNGILFFKDITDFQGLLEKYNNVAPVVGIATLDNYDETIYNASEQSVSLININIRQKVVDWCAENGILAKSYRSDSFVIFTDEEKFWKVYQKHFDILKIVRDNAEEQEVPITLSMAFAYGCNDYLKLESMVNEQLKMVENRGGDQVAICKVDGEVEFVGGNIEINENRSGVRVRVMSQAIREKIIAAEKVYIVPHQNMDMDCLGAALGVSLIAQSLGRNAYIICNDIEIEKKTAKALLNNFEQLIDNHHNFLTEQEAIADNTVDTLMIVVDHQTYDLSAAPKLLEMSNKTIVIDHHRRRKTENVPTSMIYLETSSSSTTELITEMIENNPNKITLQGIEANIMLAGILVDTNYFRIHSGSRTFMAAANLKKLGADSSEADELLKDTYEEFELQSIISAKAHCELNDFIIADMEDKRVYDRALLSKACDTLLHIEDVKAAFVIGKIDEETIGVTARSNGEVNVQVIMEKMHGGGHFQAAAVQRKNTTVKEVCDELLEVLKEYQKESEQ